MGTDILAVGTAPETVVGFMTVVGTIAVAIGTRGSSSSTVTTSSTTDGVAIGLATGFFLPPVMKGSGMTPHMAKQRQQRQYMRSQNHHGRPKGMSVVVVVVGLGAGETGAAA